MKIEEIKVGDKVILWDNCENDLYTDTVIAIAQVLDSKNEKQNNKRLFFLDETGDNIIEYLIKGVLTEGLEILPIDDTEVLSVINNPEDRKVTPSYCNNNKCTYHHSGIVNGCKQYVDINLCDVYNDKTPSLPSETIENKRCGLIECNQFNGIEKTSCSAIKCLNNLPSCASYRKYALEAHKTRCMSTNCSNYATDELNNCSAWDDTNRCGEAKIHKAKKEC